MICSMRLLIAIEKKKNNKLVLHSWTVMLGTGALIQTRMQPSLKYPSAVDLLTICNAHTLHW